MAETTANGQSLRVRLLLTLALVAALLACSEAVVPEHQHDEELAPVHYAERDVVSINDRCPVRHDPLSDEIEPVYVNGRPLGFC